jgi:hypothetical protein
MTLPHRARLVCAGLLLIPAVAAAQGVNFDTARLERRLTAVRATGPIVVDGVLDEPAWAAAPVATRFIQSEPREGEPATEESEVRVVYDDQAIYFGAFMRSPDPRRIIINDLKKDFETRSEEIFGVVLDTFHDERNGYQFATNAMGAKWDAQMVGEGREVNTDWDGIWFVKTKIVENGWYAEIQIPFRTLRFSNADPQTWGINFLRRIRHNNEDTYWSPLPRIDRIYRVSLAGTLEDLQGVKPGHDLRIKPYVLGSANRLISGDSRGDFDAGVDAKYGVTSGLTWDFTVNTDFSQVEADEQQVNLTRFTLFFPEKRDFFLENSGVFQFGPGDFRQLGGGGGGGGLGGRQNSQQDLILFFSRRIGLVGDDDNPIPIPIIAGTRLTGHAGPYSIGALNIQQSEKYGSPSTNFTALRLRRNIFGNSEVGVMFLNKDEHGSHYNRAIGADANFNFFRSLYLNAFAAKTFSPEAVVGGTTDDAAARGGIAWRDNTWELRAAYTTIGSRFNDELGFVPRVGIDRTEIFAGIHIRPKATESWLRDIYPHYQFINVDRSGGELDSRYVDYHLPFNFQNGAFLELGVNPNTEDLVDPFEISTNPEVDIQPGRYDFNEKFVLFDTNPAAPFSLLGRYGFGDFYDGYKRGYQIGGTIRPNAHFNVSLTVSINDVDLPEGPFTTKLVAGRVNYNFSTRMFLNGLFQYNTDSREWNSNVRFNLIHHPLSDFFLVYNERRNSLTYDLMDRALIAKITYLVAF